MKKVVWKWNLIQLCKNELDARYQNALRGGLLCKCTMKIKYIILLFLITGSQFVTSQSKTGGLPVIDISKILPQKQLILQEIADIEYVRLETTDDVLLCGLSNRDISVLSFVSDKYIIVYEQMRGDIFIFNRNGKIVSHFNHRGGSGQEYSFIDSSGGIIFDEKNEEIFVCTRLTIQVYSLSGKYIRTLKFNSTGYSEVYDFDDESLLVFDEVNNIDNIKPVNNPYRLISKKDGSTIYVLDINLSQRYSRTFRENYMKDKGGNYISQGWTTSIGNNMHYGQDFIIADMSSDTMYLLNRNRELTPLLVRSPSVHASEPRTVWAVRFTTDKYMMFWTITLDWSKVGERFGMSKSTKVFTYEFETGELSDLSFVSNDFPEFAWTGPSCPVAIGKNMTAELLLVSLLKEYAFKKLLKGDLEKLVASIDEDDNPIVRIIKFK